jgi:hypothetical protein
MLDDPSMDEIFYTKLSENVRALRNVVFLPWAGYSPDEFRSLAPDAARAQVVYEGSPQVAVLWFDANTLRLKTGFERPRFLLWADGYHRSWHVYIDGVPHRLLRADFAFKGTWVPSGKHTVVFRFEKPWRYLVADLLLVAFMAALVLIVVSGLKEGFLLENRLAA